MKGDDWLRTFCGTGKECLRVGGRRGATEFQTSWTGNVGCMADIFGTGNSFGLVSRLSNISHFGCELTCEFMESALREGEESMAHARRRLCDAKRSTAQDMEVGETKILVFTHCVNFHLGQGGKLDEVQDFGIDHTKVFQLIFDLSKKNNRLELRLNTVYSWNALSCTEKHFETDKKSIFRCDWRGRKKPTGYLWRLLHKEKDPKRPVNLKCTYQPVHFYDQTLRDKAGKIIPDCNHRHIGRLKGYFLHCKENDSFVDMKRFLESRG